MHFLWASFVPLFYGLVFLTGRVRDGNTYDCSHRCFLGGGCLHVLVAPFAPCWHLLVFIVERFCLLHIGVMLFLGRMDFCKCAFPTWGCFLRRGSVSCRVFNFTFLCKEPFCVSCAVRVLTFWRSIFPWGWLIFVPFFTGNSIVVFCSWSAPIATSLAFCVKK